MKKCSMVIIVIFCFLVVGVAYSEPFNPPVVTITGETVQWTEGDCVVPFTLEGRDCTMYLAVYTKGLEGTYGRVDNGMGDITRPVDLDYHTVVGIDTCIFVSTGEPFMVGNRSIKWDGKDKVGRQMEPGEYTYYLIAADETNPPVRFCMKDEESDNGWWPVGTYVNFCIQYNTAEEGKLEKPRAWAYFNSFEFGQDTEGNVWSMYEYPEGGGSSSPLIQIDPDNDDVIYFTYWDGTAESSVFGKALLNPDGPAEWVTDFAEDGKLFYYGDTTASRSGGNSKYGVSVAASYSTSETNANLWVFDSETGDMIHEIDMYEWFVSPQEDIDRGAKAALMGKWKWSHWTPYTMHNQYHCTCATIAVNPLEPENWLYWANMNGDYYCDHFFPGCQGFTEDMIWVCHHCAPGLFLYAIWNDQNNFSHYTAATLVSTRLMDVLGPDGYGICEVGILGQIGSVLWYSCLVDGETAYDGYYSCLTTGDKPEDTNIPAWTGYDSFKGSISTGVGVEAETPVAYSLSNAPDPFNPATTITYGVAKTGNVTIDIYNVMGQKVATLYDGHRDAGNYSVRWDASDFSNGVYFAIMKTEGFTKTEKMMLVK